MLAGLRGRARGHLHVVPESGYIHAFMTNTQKVRFSRDQTRRAQGAIWRAPSGFRIFLAPRRSADGHRATTGPRGGASGAYVGRSDNHQKNVIEALFVTTYSLDPHSPALSAQKAFGPGPERRQDHTSNTDPTRCPYVPSRDLSFFIPRL